MVRVGAMTERIAVVTGATGGMGGEIVADLAADHHVYALGRDETKLAKLGEMDNVTPLGVDLGHLLQDDEVIREDPDLAVVADLPHIDLLVHAAAILETHTLEEATFSDWQTQMGINALQPALLTRLLLPGLRKAKGQVIFINSISGQGASAGSIVYGASKAALRSIADSFRAEISPDGVRVASLFPSGTDTDMMRKGSAANGDDVYHPEYYSAPVEIARAVRLIADTGETTQFTNLDIRPRRP